MWTWDDVTLTLCTNSIGILTVGSVPFMQMLILLDLALNVLCKKWVLGPNGRWPCSSSHLA